MTTQNNDAAAQIARLCTDAGVPERAAAYILSGTSPSAVARELLPLYDDDKDRDRAAEPSQAAPRTKAGIAEMWDKAFVGARDGQRG